MKENRLEDCLGGLGLASSFKESTMWTSIVYWLRL